MEAERSEPRTIVVKTSLSATEFIELAQWAESLGLSQSAAIRMVVKRAIADASHQAPASAATGTSNVA